jgi:type II secretory pathway component PulF
MEDLALFTRHVAGAMTARAPLPAVLRAFGLEAERSRLRRVTDQLADRVEAGVPLAAAMEDFPRMFPPAYRRLVGLGEQGRALGGVMNQLAGGMEDNLKTYEYFRRAAVYPLIVLVILMAELGFVVTKILPKLQDIMGQLGGDLDAHMLIDPVGIGPRVVGPYLLLIALAIAFLVATLLGLRVRGIGNGRMVLSLPLLGTVLRRAETARFANNLALLLDNRVPTAEALKLMAESAENSYVRDALYEFQSRYESGERLGAAMMEQPLFPPTMATMIAAAEDQGGLVETLRALGRFYSERTAHGLTVLREAFEPILLLLTGILVAILLLSIYMPLFNIPTLVR